MRHDGQHSKEVTAVTSLGSESILSNQEIKDVYDDIEIKGISRKNLCQSAKVRKISERDIVSKTVNQAK